MEKDFNGRLKKIRLNLGLNQSEFASKLGMQQGSYSMIEKGKNGISSQLLKKLTIELNVNANWLMTGKGKMFNQYLDKPVDNGAFGSEVEKLLRDQLAEKDRQLLEKDRYIVELLRFIDPKKLGKYRVTEWRAAVNNLIQGVNGFSNLAAKPAA